MRRTGIDFAPNTAENCKRLITQLFAPEDILGAYRVARDTFKTSDLVLLVSEQDPSGFQAMPRPAYVKWFREKMGSKAPALLRALTIAHKSAHSMVHLPSEAEALWLVVARGNDTLTMDTVLFAVSYETTATN